VILRGKPKIQDGVRNYTTIGGRRDLRAKVSLVDHLGTEMLPLVRSFVSNQLQIRHGH
jgi:hypothetical protein